MKRKMFYNADPLIFNRARELRNNLTQSEQIFWLRLKEYFPDYKFRRQHPVSHYIVDYYCHKLKLVIEIDGPIHTLPENKLTDLEREKNLEGLGLVILRFTNEQVKNEIDQVIESLGTTIRMLSVRKNTSS